jgi:hypothetical protein
MHKHPNTSYKRHQRTTRLANRQTEEIRKLSAECLTVRNQRLRAQAFSAQMLASRARGELIDKDLAGKQAQYLLINMRQKMLTAPDACCREDSQSLRSLQGQGNPQGDDDLDAP